jgi:glycogen synthase
MKILSPQQTGRIDLIYIEGDGDIVEAFLRWKNKEHLLSETSRTFSGQLFDFCEKNGLRTLAISGFKEAKATAYANFIVKSIPKKLLSGSMGYHMSQILYGLRLLAIIARHRPTCVHAVSGVTYWFMFAPLKLFGIKVFPHFHNALWPNGFPPQGAVKKFLLSSTAWFLKNIAAAALCPSPEVQRQIEKVTHNNNYKVYQFLPQFYRCDFENPPAPPLHQQMPFIVVFAGRIEHDKGVFDILEMADALRGDGIVFHICGDGSQLDALTRACVERGLNETMVMHGKLQRPELLKIYSQGHVVIVPTRGGIGESFAMVAAEAILLGRPIVTSNVVPALDILRNAAMEAEPENVASYTQAIRTLAGDEELYDKLCAACLPLREQFLDGSRGLTSALQKTLESNL